MVLSKQLILFKLSAKLIGRLRDKGINILVRFKVEIYNQFRISNKIFIEHLQKTQLKIDDFIYKISDQKKKGFGSSFFSKYSAKAVETVPKPFVKKKKIYPPLRVIDKKNHMFLHMALLKMFLI